MRSIGQTGDFWLADQIHHDLRAEKADDHSIWCLIAHNHIAGQQQADIRLGLQGRRGALKRLLETDPEQSGGESLHDRPQRCSCEGTVPARATGTLRSIKGDRIGKIGRKDKPDGDEDGSDERFGGAAPG